MKIIVPFLTIVTLTNLTIQAADFPDKPGSAATDSKPTWKGDEHDQPVFSSPTNDFPPADHSAQTNTLPGITNRPAISLPVVANRPVL